ncbi:MAG: class I SAM-dependent rRNA methyltransferase [Nannocystaceae bacterium]
MSPPSSSSRSRPKPERAPQGERGGGRPRPEVRSAAPPGRRRSAPRPSVRGPSVKVSPQVARLLKAGHPWIFRSALRREVADLPEGSLITVIDDDGYTVGAGLTENDGAIAVRMIGSGPDLRWDADEMLRRLDAAKARREGLGLGATQRVIHGEADGFPGLSIDRFGDYLLIYKYSRLVESYQDTLVPLLVEHLMPAGGGLYLQDRVRPVTPDDRRPPAFHLAGKPVPPELEVEEDGLKFLVDVSAPVSPGLFLDLREGRRMAERWAAGRSVLNLFSFTGAFGLRALRGGARSVTNVDAAARSHARCRQNLSASGMDPEACEAITGDVFKHLERLKSRDRVFEMVIVDPPPFSNVKGAVFSALRDYGELMAAIAPILAPGGLVLAVCNAVRLNEEEFLLSLSEGAAMAGRTCRLIAECGLPPDFPVIASFIEGRYLKIKLLQLG